MPKVCDLDGVRGGEDGYEPELWRHEESGRLVIRVYSCRGFNHADIDVVDLKEWLSTDLAQSLTSPVDTARPSVR